MAINIPGLTDINGISIPIVSKASQWRGQQQLQYASIINYIKNDFHGLSDFQTEMTIYSSTHPILAKAWSTISSMVPVNAQVSLQMYYDILMGPVGNAFLNMIGFGTVFAASPLTQITNEATNTVSSVVSSAASTASSSGSTGSTLGVVASTAAQLAPAASIIGSAPSAINAPVPVAGITSPTDTGTGMGGTTSTTSPINANQVAGVPISGVPTTAGQYLGYTGQQLSWTNPITILPITTGAPTTPAPQVGSMMLDTSGNYIWVYANSAWKKVELTS